MVSKALEDNLFFMAGAISFDLLVALVPLLLLVVGITGYLIRARTSDPAAVVLPWLVAIFPRAGGQVDLVRWLGTTVDRLVAERAQLSVVGAVVFVWIGTQLVTTLRTVLREVFDVSQHRSFVRGKLFDAQIVVLGTALVFVNFGVTLVIHAVGRYGVGLLGLQRWDLTLLRRGGGFLLSFGSIWVLFLLIYRYLLVRRVPWRTVLVAATFTGLIHEALKAGFGWYATTIANFGSTFGNLATAAVLLIWIYYESIVFILGGEFAQVYAMHRVRRVRVREVLKGDPGGGER